jgi:MFS family permease
MLPSNFVSLLIGRFILGASCSLSISVAGSYLKQTFSERLRKIFGAIYSLSRMIGSEICYLLGYFIRNEELTHFIVFQGVSVLAIVQLILVFAFLPNIPVEMLSKKKFEEFSHTMQIFYNEKDIPNKIKEI